MRGTFVRTLLELADADDRIALLTGDLGFSVVEPFAERHPERFLNCGVAEQNMVGVATGLAESGFIPFVYSIVTFATLRPYEFVRNGAMLHRLPVRVVGVGGGFEYGHAGPTHHGIEDVGVMRMHGVMTVVAPADHRQAESALRATWDLPGPVYYRLGKDDRTELPGLDGRFALGRLQVIRKGPDLAILSMGSVAGEAVAAAEALAERGVEATVGIVASVHPAPLEDLADLLENIPAAITVEAHTVTGGLGSIVSEVVAERGIACRVVRSGVREAFEGPGGSEGHLFRVHGVDADSIVATAEKTIAGIGS